MEYKNLCKEMNKLLNNLLDIDNLENKLFQNCDELMKRINKIKIKDEFENNESFSINFTPDKLNEVKVINNKLLLLQKRIIKYLNNKYIGKLNKYEKDSFSKILFINKEFKEKLNSLENNNTETKILLSNNNEAVIEFIDNIIFIRERFYLYVFVSLNLYRMIIEENVYYKSINFEKINYIKRSINSNEIIYISARDIENAFNISILDDKQNLLIKKFLLTNHELYKNQQEEKINTLEKINIEEHNEFNESELTNYQNIISYKTQKLYSCVKNLINVMEVNDLNIIDEIVGNMSDDEIKQLLGCIKKELNEYSDLKELELDKQELNEVKNKIVVIQKLYDYIFNYLNNKNLNSTIEDSKIIFASDKQGIPFIIKDLIDSIDDNNKVQSLKKCFEILNTDTLNPTKRKKIVNNNQIDAFEIKDYQSRLIYQYLPNNYILVTQFLIKKDNNDVFTRKKISDRLTQTKNEYDSITSFLKDGQDLDLRFIGYQNNLLNKVLGIENKNSLQLLKKIV